ncbi:glucose-1-phosphate thymidylyltransferase [Leptospira sp. GIMC2001]|uniref:glucose-1-phosphate thymidylyltransferase n=1 Tax=Leptospira sp. GIMC2001 TaxID=1513297 RepID=UPI0023495F7E|nr:glucose-1-phosphate thymidylyltransferase [Leptospira sp. GIMC2001]WCL49305.1 glucose-1-phosphate thymidylyltransferase [Leptospira sp. GIMC2001]
MKESSQIKRIIILDNEVIPGLDILTRFRSFVELRVGHETILERLHRKYPQAKTFYINSNEVSRNFFLSKHPSILPLEHKNTESNYKSESGDLVIEPGSYKPWDLIQNIPNYLEEDISHVKEISKWKSKFKSKFKRIDLVGKEKHLYIHPDTIIYPGVVFDTTNGPIIIDKGVTISSFSFLEGPLYIGSKSKIDDARLTGGTVIGSQCRIGGEVSNTIIQDYSNKHHEGFLGHSFIGSWVNLGALSTTSDLKNNYGTIEIQSGNQKINTGTIKFGSVVGDYAKIGIGVMLNTGTSIDVGSNIVSSKVKGYTPPFSWIDSGEKYRLDRFLQDTKKIMSRRSMIMPQELENYISYIYSKMIQNKN